MHDLDLPETFQKPETFITKRAKQTQTAFCSVVPSEAVTPVVSDWNKHWSVVPSDIKCPHFKLQTVFHFFF